MRHKKLIPPTLFALVALTSLSACRDDPAGVDYEYQRGPELMVAPEEAGILIGETLQLSVLVREINGRLHEPGDEVNWQSSDPEVVEVTEDGMVRGLAEGRVTITAGCNGYSAWATIHVTKIPTSEKW